MRVLGRTLVSVALFLATSWGAAALWFDGPASRPLAGALAGGFAAVTLALLAFLRPFARGAVAAAVAVLIVIVWWSTILPRNDRDWQPDVARLPTAEIAGDRVTIRNVRNFDYRSETDYTPRWEERTYDLSKLTAVDMFISYWGPTAIAHTILSFEFSDAPPIAFSIETRKEVGESYSAVRGFFRQYELYYVVADERDLVGVRTNHRGEQVYVYRLKTPPPRARAVLLDYLEQVNRLARRPAWYNALTDNCTTNVRLHFQHVARNVPFDWRILANGYLYQYLYEYGAVDTSLPLETLRERVRIDDAARAADGDPDFSARIRAGRPGFGG